MIRRHRISLRGAERDVRATIRAYGLPAEAESAITRVVSRARLWRSERRDLAHELASHFDSALSAGNPIDSILTSFGDVDTAGTLIGAARRRLRPGVWQAWRLARRAIATGFVFALVTYSASAVALYFSDPAHIEAMAIAPEVNAHEARALWTVETDAHNMDLFRALGHLYVARCAAERGDESETVAHIEGAMRISRALRAKERVSSDVAAARIEARAAAMIVESIRDGALKPNDLEISRVRALLTAPVRLEGVRAAFDSLLDRMYTRNEDGDGHLTSAGIDVVRVIHAEDAASFTDRLTDPVSYFFPASRQSVRSRFQSLVEIAETSATPPATGAAAPAGDSPRMLHESGDIGSRFPAIAAIIPLLADVFTATEEAAKARRDALQALESFGPLPGTSPRNG